MLFRQRRAIFSCYFSSSSCNPKQAYNRPHLPALQRTYLGSCILCITDYFNFDDFKPDASIYARTSYFQEIAPERTST
ncbi:unnamed protein product, partial [Amoebophrya sp. A120]|eukprot:GSA120T00023848001.1